MRVIEVKGLRKSFKTKVKKEGLRGSVSSLLRPEQTRFTGAAGMRLFIPRPFCYTGDMEIAELKRKLRDMKKLEIRLRFGETADEPAARNRCGEKSRRKPDGGWGADFAHGKGCRRKLVWEEFFSTEAPVNPKVRYDLKKLLCMDKQALKDVYEEYFYFVWFRKYSEEGLSFRGMYDPGLLAMLGLPPASSFEEIRHRFRTLAKKYHPDTGGDAEKMVELLDTYHRLVDGNDDV